MAEPGVVVVGAGLAAAHVAQTLREKGYGEPVTLVGDEVARWVAALHRNRGVGLELGVPTASVVEETDGYALHLADGRVLRADAVLAGIGTEPNTDWLIGSGVELDAGVVTDPAGRTNVPGVWAGGDVASTYDADHGRHRRFEHWTHAIAQAKPTSMPPTTSEG